jgi:hypothetical protein
MASEIKVDTISEKTSANGVTIDSLSIKDGGLIAEGNIDVNGNNLVLDANANTYLDAGTDDTIKVYVAGAHDLTISANAVNVLSGTTLTIDSGATITNSGTANGFGGADPSSADGDTLGTASAEWSDLYLADSSVIYFGNDQDTTLTHTDGTGLTLNSTNKLTFGDAASFIQQSSDGVLRIDGEATVDINATAAVTIAAEGVPVTVGGIPFFADATNDSLYTHNVSGTDSTAQKNTAYGFTAMDAITTGDRNTAIGYAAGGAINSGANNQFFGRSAGLLTTTGDNNHAIGYHALGTNVSASNNTAIGFEALYTNKVAANIAIGQQAGYANDTGLRILVIGHESYDQATAEDDNVVIGYNAMDGAVSGAEYNVMVGNYTGDAITSGDKNTCIGHQAGSAITTGSSNTCMARSAGDSITTGDNNICIGDGINPQAVDQDHGIGLGSNFGVAANDFAFGKASNVVSNDFDADADWSRSSDIRLKRNIQDSTLGLDFINDLHPVKFQWKPSYEVPKELKSEYNEENKKNLDVIMHGFIAQEVKEAIDKHGDNTFGGWHLDKGDGVTQRTKKNMFVMPLIRAVQELTARVKELEAK